MAYPLALGAITFFLAVIWGRPLINWLIRNEMGKKIRVEEPGAHQLKMGTPTMGGLMVIIPVVVITGALNIANLLGFNFIGQSVLIPLSTLVSFGLLGLIDRWAVARAIDLIGERQRSGKRTSLLLSLSSEAVQDPTMASFIAANLASAGVPGEQLVLAVPESKVFTSLREAQEFVGAMAGFGVQIALERFGAGLNSMQLLTHFDPAFLKIDPQFMVDLSKSTDSQQKVRNIASQASSRGIRTIADRVQDATSMTLLFSAGVDFVQGDFLAPAGPEMTYDFS